MAKKSPTSRVGVVRLGTRLGLIQGVSRLGRTDLGCMIRLLIWATEAFGVASRFGLSFKSGNHFIHLSRHGQFGAFGVQGLHQNTYFVF